VHNVRLALHYAIELRADVRAAHVVAHIAHLRAQQQGCTPADVAPPPPSGRRIALLVGGLGSTSAAGAVDNVDVQTLDYDPADVLRFSYAGGRVPDETDAVEFRAIQTHSYDARDTEGDLEVAAQKLATMLQALAASAPGVPIDVIGHSQGGVVAWRAVAMLSTVGNLPPTLSTLALLAAPLGGADLATAAEAVRSGIDEPTAATLAARAGYDIDAPSVMQLSELSAFVATLQQGDLPAGVHAVSIAARGDLVVPLPRTIDRRVVSAVVDLDGIDAHDRLPSEASTTRELALAIAGLGPTCRSSPEQITQPKVGEGISWATTLAASPEIGRLRS
jgi:hypothetical protein